MRKQVETVEDADQVIVVHDRRSLELWYEHHEAASNLDEENEQQNS